MPVRYFVTLHTPLVERQTASINANHLTSLRKVAVKPGDCRRLVYYNKDVYLKDIFNVPWFILDTFDYVEDKLYVYYYNTPFTQILDQHVSLKTVKL